MREQPRPVGGVTLNVATSEGGGPPLYLWHGLARRWQDFAPLLPTLAPHWQVTAIDHRGHGRSGRVPGRYRVADYVADAVGLLRAEAGAPAVLYGHSLGALTALGAAAEYPDRVRGVVLEDPPSAGFLARVAGTNYERTWRVMQERAGHPDVRETARALAETRLLDGRRLGDVRDPAALRFLARCLADLDPETLVPPRDGTWLDGIDIIATAWRVRCPALLLASDPSAGGMLPAHDAADLTRALADVCRIDFPGSGHLLHGEHPAAVARVLVPFLESL